MNNDTNKTQNATTFTKQQLPKGLYAIISNDATGGDG